ncbi:MAG: ABC transporter permease [Actinomycetia bacterium]|nr:ABC transporter permease [Actinomycetes bacterium]
MPVFKTAVRLVFRHPFYLLIYIVLMGLLGLVMTGAPSGSPAADQVSFNAAKPPVAVIDRDQSEVSHALTAFLSERAELVEVADDTISIQDAIAQEYATYILVIPSGYGSDFLAAARNLSAAPELTEMAGINLPAAALANAETNNFLNALRISAATDPEAADTQLLQQAKQAAAAKTGLSVVPAPEQIQRSSLLPFFFKWASYPLTCGIIILVSLIFSSFQAGELRRRNLSSPCSTTSMNFQIAASGLIIALMAWGFICLLATIPVVGGLELLSSKPTSVLLIALAALIYSLLPLAIGFLFSQFRLPEVATNGFTNIVAMSLMFLSGIMMGGSDYLSGVMLDIGRLTPTYWYSLAIDTVAGAGDLTASTLTPYFGSLGLILLFALTVFSVALLISRLRVKSADADGNSAAETSSEAA